MDERVMTFGKYLGQPTRHVPLEYLLWVSNAFKSIPQCVADEIESRTEHYASQRSATPSSPPARRRRRRKTSRRKPGPTIRSGRVVGERFTEERAAWLTAGGDPLGCPWEEIQVTNCGPRTRSPQPNTQKTSSQ